MAKEDRTIGDLTDLNTSLEKLTTAYSNLEDSITPQSETLQTSKTAIEQYKENVNGRTLIPHQKRFLNIITDFNTGLKKPTRTEITIREFEVNVENILGNISNCETLLNTIQSIIEELKTSVTSAKQGVGIYAQAYENAEQILTGTVTADFLNIRDENGEVIGSIPNNAEINWNINDNRDNINGNGTWYHVTYNGITGWVSADYVNQISNNANDNITYTPNTSTQYNVTANLVNIRDENGDLLAPGALNFGDSVTTDGIPHNISIDGEPTQFYQVTTASGITGFVAASLLQPNSSSQSTTQVDGYTFNQTDQTFNGTGQSTDESSTDNYTNSYTDPNTGTTIYYYDEDNNNNSGDSTVITGTNNDNNNEYQTTYSETPTYTYTDVPIEYLDDNSQPVGQAPETTEAADTGEANTEPTYTEPTYTEPTYTEPTVEPASEATVYTAEDDYEYDGQIYEITDENSFAPDVGSDDFDESQTEIFQEE